MKTRIHGLTLPMVLVLAACGGDDAASRSSTSGIETVAVATEMPPTTGTLTQTTRLVPLAGSRVAGEVIVSDRDEFTTDVIVRLTGTPGNTVHQGHLHAGTCESIGPVVQALEPVTTDGTGAGSTSFVLERAPMTLLDGLHVVVYHMPDGAPAACGMIGEHTM
jgi:hypothetical protein